MQKETVADDILLVVHVENDHLPLFELSTVVRC